MPLTTCRECGAAVSTQAHACMKCGARTTAASPAPYRPAPPRRAEEPERPGWMTAVGWAAAVAGCALFALLFFRGTAAAERRVATEKAEVAREEEHMRKVIAWMEDTVVNAPVPGSASRPAPTSGPAKRLWVISRMLEDQWVWARGIMERHGAGAYEPPTGWGTAHYQANARGYPEIGTYLEGSVAAFADIRTSSPAWVEAHTAVLARESGMPAREIRDMFSRDFGGTDWEEERAVDAMVELHRHLVRVDPRVRYEARTERALYEREDDLRRTDELMAKVNEAVSSWKQARERKLAEGIATLARQID